ncbi:MAG: H-NS histone family protein [Ectothiorhodospiraceae bacterium]
MNLSKYSSDELRQLRKDIDHELAARRTQDAGKARRELQRVAEKYGFTLAELMGGQSDASGRPGGPTVRFRHPDDPSKTWSGRGRKPGWIKEWEAQGRPLDDLRI